MVILDLVWKSAAKLQLMKGFLILFPNQLCLSLSNINNTLPTFYSTTNSFQEKYYTLHFLFIIYNKQFDNLTTIEELWKKINVKMKWETLKTKLFNLNTTFHLLCLVETWLDGIVATRSLNYLTTTLFAWSEIKKKQANQKQMDFQCISKMIFEHKLFLTRWVMVSSTV